MTHHFVISRRPVAFEDQHGSNTVVTVKKIEGRRKEEVKHELRKWLGAGVSHMFMFARSDKRYTLATGVVTGVFVNTQDEIVFAVRYAQTGSVNTNYHVVASRYDLDVNTTDVDPNIAQAVNTYDEIGKQMMKAWSKEVDVINANVGDPVRVRVAWLALEAEYHW